MNQAQIDRVKQVLTEWNPLGSQANKISDLNNYETESIDILSLIDNNSSIEKIHNITTEVINQAFDLNVNLAESRKRAEMIMKIVRNK
jgi:hypothetical protein